MSLKTATVTFTDKNGYEKSMVLSVRSVVFNYKEGYTETIYDTYKDDAARELGYESEPISQRTPIDFSDTEAMILIMQTSEKLWAVNRTQPLIEDYSDIDDETGKVKQSLKSLDDLGADIFEIPMT